MYVYICNICMYVYITYNCIYKLHNVILYDNKNYIRVSPVTDVQAHSYADFRALVNKCYKKIDEAILCALRKALQYCKDLNNIHAI